MTSAVQRIHLRSPITGDVLYEVDGHVHRARLVNISEGGLLIEGLPVIPEINAIPLMFGVPQYPAFSQMSPDTLKNLKLSHLELKVLRSRARLVRSFEGLTAIDSIFISKHGCQFVQPSLENKKIIAQYIVDFARNIIFVLGLFQRSGQVEQLRHVAQLLGYDGELKLPLLRQKILHDYQSLESL